jgi:hypothetical protein
VRSSVSHDTLINSVDTGEPLITHSLRHCTPKLCVPCCLFADDMPLTTDCMHTSHAHRQRSSVPAHWSMTTLCFADQLSASQHNAQRQQASRHICDCTQVSRVCGRVLRWWWGRVALRRSTSWLSSFLTPRTPSVSSGQGLCAELHVLWAVGVCVPCCLFADYMPLTTDCTHCKLDHNTFVKSTLSIVQL